MQRSMISVVNISYFVDYYLCFVVAICDLAHDVKTIYHLSYVLTTSGNRF